MKDTTISTIALTALNGSIEKWGKIIKKNGTDRGSRNCPLCILYAEDDCKDCPVYEKIGETGCRDTPWEDWHDHHYDKHGTEKHLEVECRACKKLAKKELKFLKSLLPK